jgi:hypothetical protein
MAMPAVRKTFGRRNAPQPAPVAKPTRKRTDITINPLILAGGGALMLGAAVVMMLGMTAPVAPVSGPKITELPPRSQAARTGGDMRSVSNGLAANGR